MGILHRQAIFMVRRRVRRERRVGLIEYSYDGESLRYTECNVLDIGNLPLYNVNPIFFIFLNLCHLKANIKFEKKKERDRIVLKAQSTLQISECFHVKKKKKLSYLVAIFSPPCYETFTLLLYLRLPTRG